MGTKVIKASFVMRPKDRDLANRLEEGIEAFEVSAGPLLGITQRVRRDVFLEQLVESVHRVEFVDVIQSKTISPRRMNPADEIFDPIRAAVLYRDCGEYDEAFWLVFLFVHFGKFRGEWNYIRDIYGALGGAQIWSWTGVSQNLEAFTAWMETHENEIRNGAGPRGFGNHRKYETLRADAQRSPGAVVQSYVNWVAPPRTHIELFETSRSIPDNDSHSRFHALYKSMDSVLSFGRTAKFDYLTMIGKLNLFDISPGSTYMSNSTGPISGAKLFIHNDVNYRVRVQELEEMLSDLDDILNVGKQVLEDALCNWQKSPNRFIRFRG